VSRALELPIDEVLAAVASPAADPLLAAGARLLPPGRTIGRSREGRYLQAHRLGHGPRRISLIGGCHADEPVGPATLRRLVAWLAALPPSHPLLTAATWYVVPHVNPDGEKRNAAWSAVTLRRAADGRRGAPDRVFDLALYLRHVVRELPGDDMEFGFPRDAADLGARPENRAVADFLAGGAPFDLHGSFHGMAFATGPWFLLEPAWIERTATLRDRVRAAVDALGYQPFDVDRHGEKGFRRIDLGFTTRPDSRAMAAWFLAQDDAASAALFRPSSMEHVRALGGDPLTLVTEMPLFLRAPNAGEEDGPAADRALRADLARAAAAGGDDALRARAAELGVRGMPIGDQMRLQLAYLNAALAAVAAV
jgi:hypothetical protein